MNKLRIVPNYNNLSFPSLSLFFFFLERETVKIIKYRASGKGSSCLWLEIWWVLLGKYHGETISRTLKLKILADVLRTNLKYLHNGYLIFQGKFLQQSYSKCNPINTHLRITWRSGFKHRSLDPCPHLLKHNLWEWILRIYNFSKSSLGDSSAH